MTTPDKNYTTNPTIPDQAVLEFIQDAKRLVAFQQAIGIESYPGSQGLARFVTGQAQPATAPAEPESAGETRLEQLNKNRNGRPAPTRIVPNTSLIDLYAEIKECQRCHRYQGRNKIVSHDGQLEVKLLIIGDSPSAQDDLSGLPMSGEPGLLLDKMLAAIGLSRTEVHLALLSRCHVPEPMGKDYLEAVDVCLPFLLKEIKLVAPKVICAMGPLAAQKLLHTSKPLSQLRGKFHDFQGIPLMPTFSPEFLLKNQELKKATWLDLQMIQKKIRNS